MKNNILHIRLVIRKIIRYFQEQEKTATPEEMDKLWNVISDKIRENNINLPPPPLTFLHSRKG